MRRSSRQKKTISYRDDGSDDEDAAVPQEDAGPEYDQPQEDESDDNVESDEANSDEEDESAPRAPAAAKNSPSIKDGKAPRKQKVNTKKLKTSLIGMKGLVEYATSDMAGCKICGEKISFGELRVGKFRRAAKFDGFIPLWYHRKCFLTRWWHTIAYVEQLALDKEVEAEPRTRNFDEARAWQALEEEVNRIWKLHDEMEKEGFETRELRNILSCNKQPTFGKQDVLRLRVAETWLHGALPQCPQCSNGVLYFYPNQCLFRCMSYSSAWSKCNFSADSVERVPFVLPPESKELHPELSAKLTGTMLPLAPRRKIQRNEKKARAPKAEGAEGEKETKKKTKSGKDEKKGGGEDQVAAFVRGIPHADAGLPSSVVVKNDAGEFLSVAMSMSDITTGTNSYYILQLLEAKKGTKTNYVIFCKWGRTGTYIGSSKSTAHKSLTDAVHDFEAIFADKTGNAWADRTNFVKRPGRLCPLDLDTHATTASSAHGSDALAAATVLTRLSHSDGATEPLDPRVSALISELFSTEMLLATLEALDVDVKKMPVGKISKRQVQGAYSILREISDTIEKKGPGAEQALLDLTNRFYTMIPHHFGRRRPPVLTSPAIVSEKFAMLEALLNIEIAASLDRLGEGSANPLHVRYRSLRTEITPVETGTSTYSLVELYLNASASEGTNFRMRMLELFTIRREGESERFAARSDYIPNHFLLWHGSRSSNYVGILSQGLRIAPPEAPPSGYMFGKGVYFADVSVKSASFCGATPQYPTGFLLLSEVALGTPAELTQPQYMEAPQPNTHSTWAKGQRAPSHWDSVQLPSESFDSKPCSVPLGSVRDFHADSPLRFNEYIVYDTSQVRQRFLLKVAFEFVSP